MINVKDYEYLNEKETKLLDDLLKELMYRIRNESEYVQVIIESCNVLAKLPSQLVLEVTRKDFNTLMTVVSRRPEIMDCKEFGDILTDLTLEQCNQIVGLYKVYKSNKL